jgi:hypothetical protein
MRRSAVFSLLWLLTACMSEQDELDESASSAQAGSCGGPVQYFGHSPVRHTISVGGRCYWRSSSETDQLRTRMHAALECRNQGGVLAEWSTQAEQEQIVRGLDIRGSSRSWVAATVLVRGYESEETRLLAGWDTRGIRSAARSLIWMPGEPTLDEAGGGAVCTELREEGINNLDCDERRDYICMSPPPGV